ncbi:lipase [Nocardia panacis]|uniref:Lipase n=1 Tax=Nocardia panacis TaxID=2340916 RepID=A0A3A4K147_9NOCA|nr:lipase family protein [Nocardia panacis]RJO73440.1 lipase [Nocardia panacis]
MRCLLAITAALTLLVAAPAAAEPEPPPIAPPQFTLPGLPDLIDQLIPPPPIPPLGPRPPAGSAGLPPELAALRAATLPMDVGDPIFDEWPDDLAAHAPGEILAVRDITASAAPLVLVPIAAATLLKFRSTDAHGAPSFGTATLVVPATPWSGPGGRPVVVNNLPIDALGRACDPSYTLAHGFSLVSSNFTDFVPPTTQLAALRGYAVLIPDHEGPWMAYAEPIVAGHIVLDAIRAVRELRSDEFGASGFAMTGYSGGAIATHGAVKLIEGYAPELAGSIVGAALGGVPADFELLARSMNANLASGVFMGAVFGIGRERPEILAHMNNLAQWVTSSPLKDTCAGVFALPGVLMLPIDIGADIPDPLHSPLAADIYAVTRMAGLKSAVPLYIYNGEQEFWIPAAGARELYAQQCALGVPSVYRSVFGEHVLAAALGYPGAIGWLDARLRGEPAPNEC